MKYFALEQISDCSKADMGMWAHVEALAGLEPAGTDSSQNTNGPTMRFSAAGSARRTMKLLPRSRGLGVMICWTAALMQPTYSLPSAQASR